MGNYIKIIHEKWADSLLLGLGKKAKEYYEMLNQFGQNTLTEIVITDVMHVLAKVVLDKHC